MVIDATRGTVVAAVNAPCVTCPWRTENQGKRTPDGWFSKTNLRSLWVGLRQGVGMTCHSTDPANPVSEAQAAAGFGKKGDGATRECAGAVILQQREVMIFQAICKERDAVGKNDGFAVYRRARPRGLTRDGLANVVADFLFQNTPLGRDHGQPNLAIDAVGYPPVAGWEAFLLKGDERE